MAKQPIIGYIVTSEYFFGEPLELTILEPYPGPVLLRGDDATLFKTRRLANLAIEKTIEWARMREAEDKEPGPLEWAEKNKYKIWRVRRDGHA